MGRSDRLGRWAGLGRSGGFGRLLLLVVFLSLTILGAYYNVLRAPALW